MSNLLKRGLFPSPRQDVATPSDLPDSARPKHLSAELAESVLHDVSLTNPPRGETEAAPTQWSRPSAGELPTFGAQRGASDTNREPPVPEHSTPLAQSQPPKSGDRKVLRADLDCDPIAQQSDLFLNEAADRQTDKNPQGFDIGSRATRYDDVRTAHCGESDVRVFERKFAPDQNRGPDVGNSYPRYTTYDHNKPKQEIPSEPNEGYRDRYERHPMQQMSRHAERFQYTQTNESNRPQRILPKDLFPGMDNVDVNKMIKTFERHAHRLKLTEEEMFEAGIQFFPKKEVEQYINNLEDNEIECYASLKQHFLRQSENRASCHSADTFFNDRRSFNELCSKANSMLNDPRDELFKFFFSTLVPSQVRERARRCFKYPKERFLEIMESALDEYYHSNTYRRDTTRSHPPAHNYHQMTQQTPAQPKGWGNSNWGQPSRRPVNWGQPEGRRPQQQQRSVHWGYDNGQQSDSQPVCGYHKAYGERARNCEGGECVMRNLPRQEPYGNRGNNVQKNARSPM